MKRVRGVFVGVCNRGSNIMRKKFPKTLGFPNIIQFCPGGWSQWYGCISVNSFMCAMKVYNDKTMINTIFLVVLIKITWAVFGSGKIWRTMQGKENREEK